MAYHLEGRLLEVCNCRVLCPCWIGEDPDFGTCDTIVAWHFDKGTVDGVDVSGRTIAMIAHVPGQHPAGQLDAPRSISTTRCRPQQEQALLGVYTGQKGGPDRGARQARRQGGVGAEGADHVHRAGRQRHDQDRQCRLRRARAVQERDRRDDDARRHGVLDGARRAGVRRQGEGVQDEEPAELGKDINIKGHNALQSTFVFDA